MKKLIAVISVPVMIVFVFSACSKSPVGPSMPSMSIGSNAASSSSSSSTICVTSNSGGATTVSTSQSGIVSTQSGNTGVTSINGSTGVDSSLNSGTSSTSGTITVSTSTGSTITVKIDGTIDHTLYTTSSRTPTFAWDASGVDLSYQLVRISIMCLNPIQTMWIVEGVARSRGSIVYGNASGGTVLNSKVDLIPGSYAFDIDVYDANNNSNSVLGGGNFIIQ